MKRVLWLLVCLSAVGVLTMAQVSPSMRLVWRAAGVDQGRAGIVDVTGSGGTVTVTSNVATLNLTGGGGGAPTGAQYWVGAPDGTLTSEIDLSAVTTGLLLNSSGTPSAYGGTSCTNQFPRSLNASGAATCASVDLMSDTAATALSISKGGTGQTTNTAAFDALAPASPAKGTILVYDGSDWVNLPGGVIGQFLRYNTTTGTNLEWTTGPNVASLAADASNSSSTVTSVLGIGYAPAANTWFGMTCDLFYQTAAATTGITIGLFANNGGGTAAPQFLAAKFAIGGFGAAGTDATWEAHTAASGTLITTTGVTAQNTYYLLRIDALILTHATATDTTIVPLFRSEVNLSTVTIRKGSYCNGYVLRTDS